MVAALDRQLTLDLREFAAHEPGGELRWWSILASKLAVLHRQNGRSRNQWKFLFVVENHLVSNPFINDALLHSVLAIDKRYEDIVLRELRARAAVGALQFVNTSNFESCTQVVETRIRKKPKRWTDEGVEFSCTKPTY